jgi:hypothetical protein
MKIMEFINFPVFFISFLIGVLFIYLSVNDIIHIKVFPSPENESILQYRDKSGKCFESHFTEMICPADESLIKKIPEQV